MPTRPPCTWASRSATRGSWRRWTRSIAAFRAKSSEFGDIVKMGRTQLQDAVPMTLGQEFTAFAETLAGEIGALEAVQRVLCEINMGGTAIGTGLNAPAGYAEACTRELAAITRAAHLSRAGPD